MHPKTKKNIEICSKETLEQLYLIDKLSDSQIAKTLKLSPGIIHRLRQKYQINSIEYYERHPKQALSQKEKEFLIGSLLGDGSLRLRGKNKSYPQLILEQSDIHLDYIQWSKNEMKDWIIPKDLKIRQKKTKDNIYYSYGFSTICHPVFKEFYDGFYSNKKIINKDFIEKYISEYSLAIWLMDDGTLSNKRNIMLCSHGFTKDENEVLRDILMSKFQIESNVWRSNNKYYLGLLKSGSEKITELVKDYVIPSMQYKLIG